MKWYVHNSLSKKIVQIKDLTKQEKTCQQGSAWLMFNGILTRFFSRIQPEKPDGFGILHDYNNSTRVLLEFFKNSSKLIRITWIFFMRKPFSGGHSTTTWTKFLSIWPLLSSSRQTWTFCIPSTLFIGNSSQNSVRNSTNEIEMLFFICNISVDSKNLPLSRRRVAFRYWKQDDQRPPMIFSHCGTRGWTQKNLLLTSFSSTCQVNMTRPEELGGVAFPPPPSPIFWQIS